MPIRIYALAKDLKIDSKDLVDICTKAGIPGKGSALASLEDDEIVKLKSYMEGSTAKKTPPGPAPLVDTRAVLSTPVAGTFAPASSSAPANADPPADRPRAGSRSFRGWRRSAGSTSSSALARSPRACRARHFGQNRRATSASSRAVRTAGASRPGRDHAGRSASEPTG